MVYNGNNKTMNCPHETDNENRQPEMILRAKHKNTMQATNYALPRKASLSDLRKRLSKDFGIEETDVTISTCTSDVSPRGWKKIQAHGATLICDIFRNRDEMLVEEVEEEISEELRTIMRRISEQEEERQAKLRRWEADQENDFVVASFRDWKLKVGTWGYELVDYLWPDFDEVNSQLHLFRSKRAHGRRMQKLPNQVLHEIKMFEALENKYKTSTTVTDILTGYLQLSCAMEFSTCNGIATLISEFSGSTEYLESLPENELLLATFWNNVCANFELLEKKYNDLDALTIAETLTKVCTVRKKEDSNLDLKHLAYVLRKNFPEATTPSCSPLEDLNKYVTKLLAWDKVLCEWFVDHGLLLKGAMTPDTTCPCVRLLGQAGKTEQKSETFTFTFDDLFST